MPKTSTNENSHENVQKCGEIFYGDQVFTIICSDCNEKHLDFQTFSCHFKEVHCEYEDKEASEFEHEHPIALTESFISTNSMLLEFPINGRDSFSDEENDVSESDQISDKDFKPVVMKTLKDPIGPRRTHVCEQCGNKFVSAHGLNKHVKQKHLETQEYTCGQCEESFHEKHLLFKHERDSHVLFSCLVCEKVFKNRRNLQKHSESHNENQNQACDFKGCGKKFKSQRRLKEHYRLHTAERNYVCEICGYRTLGKHTLDAHIRTHTGEKPYACKTCGKHFISMSMVKEHAATHLTERRHKCNVCEATFTRPKALYHHMPLHLGIRKFHCSICDKRYMQAAGLSAHMRKHKVDGKIRLRLD